MMNIFGFDEFFSLFPIKMMECRITHIQKYGPVHNFILIATQGIQGPDEESVQQASKALASNSLHMHRLARQGVRCSQKKYGCRLRQEQNLDLLLCEYISMGVYKRHKHMR